MNERNAARSLRLGDQIPPTVCHFQRSLASERFHRTVSLALLCLVLPIFAHASSRCLAQGSKTITADTGVQFEGKYFSVKDISETTAAMSMVHNGFEPIVIDNGLRLVFLNPSHVQAVGNSTQDKETSFNVDQHDANWSEGGGTFVSVSPFDQYGHRDFTIGIQTKGGTPVRKTYVQGIVEITPRYCVLKNLIGSENRQNHQYHQHHEFFHHGCTLLLIVCNGLKIDRKEDRSARYKIRVMGSHPRVKHLLKGRYIDEQHQGSGKIPASVQRVLDLNRKSVLIFHYAN